MIPENEYQRLLTAGRIFFTAATLNHALDIATALRNLRLSEEAFENMVAGGKDALPHMTRLVFDYQWQLAAAAGLLAGFLLWKVWTTARLSTMVWAGAALWLLPIMRSILVQFGIVNPLTTIITKFQE
ncbi:MAG: hypothetical protein EOP86_10890 [Verrucomicrobiaceae bacterium]|nr:MAG: hypothetical protein EOP86_10890 [Verrucomicrobiaceae bacterium]